ncbi:MAG: hypothetical protein IPM97_00200 [Bdellovibrionaceae bacterium]|nr:hypothetical protein [Pseudobdellovibrionaceae bacterium]
MRLVVWNCHQGLDKKAELLADLRPDIAIVPECANPLLPKLASVLSKCGVTQSAWNGNNQQKGLGVFIFNNAVKAESIETLGGKFSIKIDLDLAEKVSLIAVWTQNPGYIEEAHKTVETYKKSLNERNVIFAGDFNSNKIWDSSRTLNHTALVDRLKNEFGLASAYHHHFGEDQGQEKRATLYFTYNEKKPYHIDYVFIPQKWLSKIKAVHVGEFKKWIHVSDHCPLVLEIDV